MEEVYTPVTGATAGITEPSVEDYISYGRMLIGDIAHRLGA
jgi:hypothetical protein